MAQGVARLRQGFPALLEDAEHDLTFVSRLLFDDLSQHLVWLDERRASFDAKSKQVCKTTEAV